MRRLVWAVVILLVMGCSGGPAPADHPSAPAPAPSDAAAPAPAPDPVAAVPDPCAPAEGAVPDLEVWGHYVARRMDRPGGCQFVVDTLPFTLSAPAVQAATAADAAAALTVVGAQMLRPADVRENGNGAWHVTLSLGPGAAGDKVTVTLTPAPDAAPVTATLIRKAGPSARVLLQGADGTWAPLRSGASLPPGPKRLRVQGSGDRLGPLGLQYYGPGWQNQIVPDRLEQVAPDTLELEFAAPPAMLQLVISGADGDGLWIPAISAHFYIGDPPMLEIVDTQGARPVGEVPPEILHTAVAGDGRHVALTTLDPAAVEGYQDWIVDLQTGQVTMLPFASAIDQSYPGFDARGRLVAPLDWGRIGIWEPGAGTTAVQASAATFWGPISPDGRYIAGRDGAPFGRSTGAWVGPPQVYHLIIRDLMTDTERVLPWTGYAQGLFWLPDGRLVQMTSDSNREPGLAPGPETAPRCYVISPATGARSEYDGACRYPQAEPVSYDPPAGTHLLAQLPDGRALVVRWPNWENQRRPLGP